MPTLTGCPECEARLGHAHELHCSMHCCPLSERLRKENERLKSALREIANPLKALRDRVPSGHSWDAQASIRMVERGTYHEELARKALEQVG